MSIDGDLRVDELEAAVQGDTVTAVTGLPEDAGGDAAEATVAAEDDNAAGAAVAGRQAAPSTGRRSEWWPFIAIALLLALATTYVSTGQAQWLSAIGGVVALAAVVRAVRAERVRERVLSQPLTLIGIGLSLIVSSELMHALGRGSLSYGDALTLLSYPPLIAGLIRLTQARFRESALDTLLVAAIMPASLGVFAWLPLVETIQRWSPGGGSHSWTAAAFLAVDVLAVAIMARLTVFFRGKPVAYQLLLGALACLLGAHISRTVGALTGLVPAPFGCQTLILVAFGLVAAAALHPSMRRATRAGRARPVPVGRGHLGLLTVAILAGPAIVIWRFLELGSWVVIAAAGPALVSLLVVVHLSRMIRERQRLEFATNHDPLTGLVNRTCFHDRVTFALGRGHKSGSAVMFIDLDRFKNVNDTLGHEAGDELLRQVAARLAGCARGSDTVSRISGDEFAVLLPDTESAAGALRLGERMLGQFERPFRIGGRSLFMTPSIGIALYPQHGDDVETLLRHADAAMYQAKAAGRHTIRMYDGAMGVSTQRQLAVEARLHRAIEDGELRLHYQPKLDVRTGQVRGVEALVRWQHPTLGLIPPTAFVRIAEETGQIAPLGAWVLRHACTQLVAWHDAGYDDLHVSVNVSARQFTLQDVPAVVRDVLADTGLRPDALELELTDSVGLDPGGAVGAALLDLRAMGVRCSIDDFGTGYSSIRYLHKYPVDTIKLDKSFVAPIDGADDAPIVRAVIAMAHNLGIRVVAEGVETKAQLRFLRKHGCDEAQGFLFSQPLEVADVSTFLDDRAARTAAARRDVPAAALVTVPVAALDEEALGRLVWAESQLGVGGVSAAGEDVEDEDGQRRRVAVLFLVTGIMVMPVLMGLGASGGLPPAIQRHVTGAVQSVGMTAPKPAPEPARVGGEEKPGQAAKAPTKGKSKPGPAHRGVAREPGGAWLPGTSGTADPGRDSSTPAPSPGATVAPKPRATGPIGAAVSGSGTTAKKPAPKPTATTKPTAPAPTTPAPGPAPTPAPANSTNSNKTNAPGQIKKTSTAPAASFTTAAPTAKTNGNQR